ncbi:uncharacterized protein LOC134217189 [Armigeres subalbatus]|uniref:uncharacterized protein LOC134217189 n=1 Tax=Armigeres subalbatus TaxID=124917 RepID=UPI002ED14F45
MNQQLLHQQQQQLHQQQRRRQSLLTKNVQEEYLIKQVELHPVLYDKSLKAYRKPGATDNAWVVIADSLGVRVEDCKKRWKSLRDTFIKYFRQEILASSMPGMKRKKWVYFEHMSFLRGHVELYGISETDSIPSDKETVVPEPSSAIHIQNYVGTDQSEYLTSDEGVEEQYDDNTEYIYEEVEEASAYAIETKPNRVENISGEQETMSTTMIDDGHELVDLSQEEVRETITVPVVAPVEKVTEIPGQAASITDPDERFLLSCAPVLKRLSTQKNALLKLKIQQLLYEVEFGDSDVG